MGAKNTRAETCRRCGKAASFAGPRGRIKIGDWICLDCIRRRASAWPLKRKACRGGQERRRVIAELMNCPEPSGRTGAGTDSRLTASGRAAPFRGRKGARCAGSPKLSTVSNTARRRIGQSL